MTHMVLSDGVAYVEKPEQNADSCKGCAFDGSPRCSQDDGGDEVFHESLNVFGDECFIRGVIYIKADPQPVKAEG